MTPAGGGSAAGGVSRFASPKGRVGYLLEINQILRASLDLTETLPVLARHLVPILGDWCVVDVAGDGKLDRLAAAHADPARHERAQRLLGTYALDAEAAWAPARVMRRGRLLYLPQIHDPTLLAPKGDSERHAIVTELGLGAVVSTSMLTSERVCGVLTCVRAPASQPFHPLELAVMRLVAAQTAEAVVHGQMYHEIQTASRVKDDFMAMLGHELRNPIAAISNAVQVLDRLGTSEDQAARARAIIGRQAGHLARLVDDLLDMARLTSGKITLRRTPVDLRKVAKRCLAVHEGMDGKRHEVVLDAEPTVVFGDPTRLEQVLGNLLDNALKYTPKGGRIEVSVRRDGESAVLMVRDSGIGIAPEVLPRIFDLFTQGAQPLSREGSGLGIGLTLVRRLVELHGGTVTAKSGGPGKGALVEVVLPLAPAAAARAPAAPAPPAAVAPAPRRILIVEDNADAREALATLLTGDGHTVQVAENGHQALERAGGFRAEVALIDIGLPGMDGYELARRLRTLGGPPLHLVALTGYGQADARQRTREAGFAVHLVKPVDPEALARVLAALDRPAAPAAS